MSEIKFFRSIYKAEFWMQIIVNKSPGNPVKKVKENLFR